MANVTLQIPTNKRLVVPAKFEFTLPLLGDDFVEIPFFFSGAITHLTIQTTAGGNPKGKVRIENVDLDTDLFQDPKPGNPDVLVDFYEHEMRKPVNGNYKLHFSDLPDGDYKGEITLEERPRRV